MTTADKLDKLCQKLSNGKMCMYCKDRIIYEEKIKQENPEFKVDYTLHKADCMHHYVRRWNTSTRWLVDNLQPSCITCHNMIHDGNLKEYPVPEYVEVVGRMLFKDVCAHFGKTKEEMMKHYAKKLKEILKCTMR